MKTKNKLNLLYLAGILLFVAYLLLRLFVFTFFEVYGSSMYPTFKEGDVLFCRKINDAASIVVGDIVIAETDGKRVVKRVAGTAGNEQVRSADGTEVVCEKVPDGCVFLLGDNAANSRDSRVYGAVPYDRIKYVWSGTVLNEWVWYIMVGSLIVGFITASGYLEYQLEQERRDKNGCIGANGIRNSARTTRTDVETNRRRRICGLVSGYYRKIPLHGFSVRNG